VHFQRGEFRRDDKKRPILPKWDGSVAIEFAKGHTNGGRSTLGTVSFVGFDRAVNIDTEANHIVLVNGNFQFCRTVVRSNHDQAFGVHFIHANIGHGCETVFDINQGGRFQADYLYINAPRCLVARFADLGSGRSRGRITQLDIDGNADGWRLLEVDGPGPLRFDVGLHSLRGVQPAPNWVQFNGDWSKHKGWVDLNIDAYTPGHKLPAVRVP
jgi:hypothetical protein